MAIQVLTVRHLPVQRTGFVGQTCIECHIADGRTHIGSVLKAERIVGAIIRNLIGRGKHVPVGI